MIRVDIKNDQNIINWSACFDSQELADVWIAQESAKNSFGQNYSVTNTDISTQNTQDELNRQALEYLNSTDWYIIRQIDSGEECPQDIKNARQTARNNIVR